MNMRRALQLFSASLLVMASGVAAAQPAGGQSLPIIAASAWRGDPLPRLLPVHRIRSYARIISASGDEADIYYPALHHKRRSQYTDSFPLIVMLQGALVDKEYYSQFAQGIARYGFVVVVPNHLRALLGEPSLFPDVSVITDVLEQMQREDASPDSPVYGIIDTGRMGLSGHSFGGAAALFAIGELCSFPFCDPAKGFQRPPELQAAALAGANSGSFDLDTAGIPVALLSGDMDAGLEGIEATYATLETPRALMILRGANHFGLSDIGAPPGARLNPDESPQEIPQSITAARFARWSGLFLRAHLHRDPQAWRRIYRSGGDADVRVTASAR